LRPYAKTTGRAPADRFLRPKFWQQTVDLGTGSDIQHRITFDQQLAVAGIMLEALDGDTDRVDGLIKQLTADLAVGNGGSQERVRLTWGQARAQTIHTAGFGDDDVTSSAGVVYVPLLDPENSGGLLAVGLNDSITLHFDTAATAEEHYTGTTLDGDEKVRVTIVAFSGVLNRNAPRTASTEVRGAPNNAGGRRAGRRSRRLGR
jgi:hypothetical protein